MSKQLLVLVTGVLAAMLVCGSAFADGQFGPESDILGFKLSMSQKQAKDYYIANYKGNSFATIPINLTTEFYKTDTVAGFMFDINKSKNNKNVIDRVQITYNPNSGSKDIFAVYRYTKFISSYTAFPHGNSPEVKGTLVLKKVVLDSLIKKYGEPALILPGSVLTDTAYIWAVDKNTVNKVNRNNTYVCINHNYFYETPYDYVPIKNAANSAASNFINTINLMRNQYEQCGMILRVDLHSTNAAQSSSQDYPYMESMSENLIDLTKGTLEITNFANSFSTAANAAKEERLQQDSKNKPSL